MTRMISGPIRVLVVDDHPMAQSGARHFLNAYTDLELVGEASNGEEALELCGQLHPDVVLMDMMMPGMDGVATTQAVKQRCPEAQVIALTSFNDGTLIARALRAGAISYLLKSVSAFDLAQAIRAAFVGRSVLAQEATAALVQQMRQSSDLGGDLTERERDVLRLMTQGLSNSQIAEQLHITKATVKFHVGSIFTKLGVSSRSEVIALAYKRGLVV